MRCAAPVGLIPRQSRYAHSEPWYVVPWLHRFSCCFHCIPVIRHSSSLAICRYSWHRYNLTRSSTASAAVSVSPSKKGSALVIVVEHRQRPAICQYTHHILPAKTQKLLPQPIIFVHESRSSATSTSSRHPAIAWSQSLPSSRCKPLQEGHLVTVVEHRQKPGILPIHKLTREEPSIPQHPRPPTYQLMFYLHTHTLYSQLLVCFAQIAKFFLTSMSMTQFNSYIYQ